MTRWELLPDDHQVILQCSPDLRQTTFEWAIRPGISVAEMAAAEEWIQGRIEAWREGRGLEDVPWIWDNAAAKYQVVARSVVIDGGT